MKEVRNKHDKNNENKTVLNARLNNDSYDVEHCFR